MEFLAVSFDLFTEEAGVSGALSQDPGHGWLPGHLSISVLYQTGPVSRLLSASANTEIQLGPG